MMVPEIPAERRVFTPSLSQSIGRCFESFPQVMMLLEAAEVFMAFATSTIKSLSGSSISPSLRHSNAPTDSVRGTCF